MAFLPGDIVAVENVLGGGLTKAVVYGWNETYAAYDVVGENGNSFLCAEFVMHLIKRTSRTKIKKRNLPEWW